MNEKILRYSGTWMIEDKKIFRGIFFKQLFKEQKENVKQKKLRLI